MKYNTKKRTVNECARYIMLLLVFLMPFQYAIATYGVAQGGISITEYIPSSNVVSNQPSFLSESSSQDILSRGSFESERRLYANTPPPHPQEINIITTIPEYGNSNNMPLNGTTTPRTTVDVYVNGNLFGAVLSNDEGFFSFRRLLLVPNTINNVTVVATREDGLRATVSGLVMADDIPPEFESLVTLPEYSPESQFDIYGQVNEFSRILIETKPFSQDSFTIIRDVEVSSEFTFNESVSFEDGYHDYRITAIDRAGNRASRSGTIFVDTVDPEILEDNIADLSPTYSRSITIRGKVSKEATVIIALESADSQVSCFDLTGSDDEIRSLGNLKDLGNGIGCIGISAGAKTYTVQTDSDGNFQKEVSLPLSLSGTLAGAVSPSNVRSDETAGQRIDLTGTSTPFTTKIELIAVDRVGRTDTKTGGSVDFATCSTGQSAFVVFQTNVFPASIVPDHIFQGIAQISFELEVEPLLIQNVQDIRLSVAERQVSREDRDVWDFNVFNPSNCAPTSTPDKQRWFVTCRLNRWPPNPYQNITSAYDDFKEQGSVKIPLNLVISYDTIEGQEGQQLRSRTGSQIVCYDLEFPLDIRLDPKNIPTGLLNSSVQILERTIALIDRILPLIVQVKWIVFATCLGMMLWNYLSNIGETAACWGISSKGQDLIETAIWSSPNLNVNSRDQGGSSTRELLEDIFKDPNNNNDLLTRFLKNNEGQIEATLRSCIVAKERFIRVQHTMQGFCDRIFCPTLPSAQKYSYDEQLIRNSMSACAPEFQRLFGSERGLSFVRGASESDRPNRCEMEYQNMWSSACFGYDPLQKSRDLERSKDPDFFEKTSNNLNTIFSGLSICELAQGKRDQQQVAISTADHTILRTDDSSGQSTFRLAQETRVTTTDVATRQRIGDPQEYYEDVKIVGIENNNKYNGDLSSVDECVILRPSGEDYVFDSSKAQLFEVSNAPTVGTSRAKINQTVSMSPIGNDNQRYVDRNGMTYTVNNGIATREKFHFLQRSVGPDGRPEYRAVLFTPTSQKPMPPREQCFTSPAITEQRTNDILIDPTASVINAVRCVCLPAIEGYLISIRNVLSAIKNCFESILITGEFNAGVCKAILTQYLCDFVYDLLGCLVQTASYTQNQIGIDERPSPITAFFTDLRSGGDKIRDATSKRYGNAQSFEQLFNQRQILRSICLAAFGYDWKPDLESAISMTGGGIQINSTGLVAPATRRFNGWDPIQEGIANHVYHVGYFLTAGGPLAWRLELVCSTTNDCDPAHFEGGRCDCASQRSASATQQQFNPMNQPFGIGSYFNNAGGALGDPTVGATRVIDGGVLEGGQTIGGGGTNPFGQLAGGSGSGDLYISDNSPVRYDRARLCWTPTAQDGHPGCITVRIRQTGGNYPPFCSFSIALGKFSCGFFGQGGGSAYIDSVREVRAGSVSQSQPGERPFNIDENIQYEVLYTLQLDDESRGILRSQIDETDYFLRMRFLDERGVLLRQIHSGANDLLSSNGRLVYPIGQHLTPVQLIGAVSNRLVSSSTRATAVSVSSSSTSVLIQTPPGVARFFESGTENSLLFFKYNGTDLFTQVVPRSELVTGEGTTAREQSISQYLEHNRDGIKTLATKVSGLFQVRMSYRSTDNAPTAVLFNVSSAQDCTNNTPCFAYITLDRDTSSSTITQRCQANGNEPLSWRVDIGIVRGDENNNPTMTLAIPPPQRQSEMKIPLRVACNFDSTGNQPIVSEATSSN